MNQQGESFVEVGIALVLMGPLTFGLYLLLTLPAEQLLQLFLSYPPVIFIVVFLLLL